MANNIGWVKIHRKMIDNPGYLSEPFCRNMAWVDLILLANYKEGFYRVRNIRVNVARGQVGYAVETLATRWKWSRGKVERFIKELEEDNQIVRQKNNVTTLFTIVNYELYNGDGKANDNADDNTNDNANNKATGHQTVTQTDISKEGKEEIRIVKNKRNNKKQVQPVSPLLIDFCFEGEDFKKLFLAWLKHLSDKGKTATEGTIIQQMQFLKKYDEAKAIGIIEYSLKGGYTTFYEPKINDNNGKNGQNYTHRAVVTGDAPGAGSL